MSPIRPTRVLAALLLAACSSATEPVGGIEIRPAALTFTRTMGGSAQVPYTVVNAGETSVLVTSRCGDHLTPVIERRIGGEWTGHSGGFCQTINPMSPVPLVPGARRDEIAFVDQAGQYRLVLGTERGPVVSATFTVQ